MFLRKIIFYSIVTMIFIFFVNSFMLLADDMLSEDLSDAAQSVETMIDDLQVKIEATIEDYNYNIAQASLLLGEVEEELKKIHFVPFDPSTSTLGDILPSSIATIFQNIIDESDYPEWVKIAQMSSPTIKVSRAPEGCRHDQYCAKEFLDAAVYFILHEKDHTLWIKDNVLYGYDIFGNFFIQEQAKERVCSGSI